MSAGRSGREPYRVYEVDDFLSGAESAERAPDWDEDSAPDAAHTPSPDWVRDRPASRRARRGVPILIAALVAVLVMAVERRTSVAPVAPGRVPSRTPTVAGQPLRARSSSREASPRIARLHPAAHLHVRRAPTRVVTTVSGMSAAEVPERRDQPVAAPAKEFGFER